MPLHRTDKRRMDAAQGLEGLRILYVEDEEDLREVTATMLTMLGCEIHCVSSADDAVREALQEYDLLLSDVRMPGSMDGVELAKWVSDHYPALPILLVSGYFSEPERLSGVPVKVLKKPYSLELLQATLLTQLQGMKCSRLN